MTVSVSGTVISVGNERSGERRMDDGSVNVVGILSDDPSEGMEELLDPWLDIVATDDGGYPYTVRRERADGNEDGESSDRTELRELARESSTVKLGRAKGGNVVRYRDLEVTVTVHGPDCPYHLAPCWRVWTDQYQFRPALQPGDTAADRTEQLLELARIAHLRTGSVYTYAQRFAEVYDPAVHVDPERVRTGALDELYWLTVPGPDTVDAVGREALLAAGADRAEALGDGSVLLVVGDTPVERDVPAFRRFRDELT